jgi:DNA-binding NtrC family response regulator
MRADGGSVLLIDDDGAFRFAMRKALGRLGYDIAEAASGEEALVHLTRRDPPDAALLDLKMEGIGGLDVLRRRGGSPTRIVVLTGHGTVQAAVEAMKLGAFSFLEKPVDAEVLAPLLAQAVAETRRALGTPEGDQVPPIVGTSRSIEDVRQFVQRVGPVDETVAIYGETGTGKEVVARHIHLASPRADGAFVALNAACVPRDLFESELFGHKRGAFTGATGDRRGLFKEASGGTLFIDELAELPIESQAKLLRALETHTIRSVGDTGEVPVDVRIIAATNRDLWTEVQAGRFREDLYFRLQVFPVVLRPLRERREDVVPLAEHLLGRMTGPPRTLDADAHAALMAYDWPGNVRELLNVLRRASLFAEGEHIGGELVRRMIAASVFAHASARPSGERERPLGDVLQAPASGPPGALPERASLAEVERAHIEQTLARVGGNITRAAAALGIDRRTLQRKLRAYGIAGED